MITLITLPAAFGLRNTSPFCLKIEMALKHLNLEFEIEILADPRKAPKGKLPFLKVDGKKIPDSELILAYLDKISNGQLFGDLSPQERAAGVAFTRLAEDHLYWLMVASRWLDPAWFPNIVTGFFGFVPALFRGFAARAAQKQVARTLDLHGLGRHDLEEQKDFDRADLLAINDQVAANHYITGGRLSVYDFAVASLLAGLLDNQPSTWIGELAGEYPGLRDYADRIQAEVGVYVK